MADEVLELGVEAVGADEAVKKLGDVENATRRVVVVSGQQSSATSSLVNYTRQAAAATTTQAAAAVQQARAVAQTTNSVTAAGRGWGQYASALGNVGSVVGRISPALGNFGSILGSVGAASTALTGAMGPVGVGIAAVTTAVGIAIPLIQSLSGDLDETAEAAANAEQSVSELANTWREFAAQQNQRIGLAASGDIQGSISEVRDALAQRNRELGQLRAEFERASNGAVTLEEAMRRTDSGGHQANNSARNTTQIARDIAAAQRRTADLQAQIAELESGLATAQRNEAGFGRQATPGTAGYVPSEEELRAAHDRAERVDEEARRRREQASRSGAARARAEREREQQEDERLLAQWNQMWTDRAQERADADRAAIQNTEHQIAELHRFWAEIDGQTTEQIIENRNRLNEKETELRDQQKQAEIAKAEDAKRRSAELGQITEGAWSSVGSSVQNFLGEAFAYIQQGNEMTGEGFLLLLDRFLEATAIEYTLKALAEGGNAIAAFARYDYAAGPQHLAAAGIYAAVAAGTGIAGAAISVPSASPNSGAATAQGAAGASGSGGGTQNITIQVFSPNAVYSKAEQGQLITGVIRETQRALGPAAARV